VVSCSYWERKKEARRGREEEREYHGGSHRIPEPSYPVLGARGGTGWGVKIRGKKRWILPASPGGPKGSPFRHAQARRAAFIAEEGVTAAYQPSASEGKKRGKSESRSIPRT